VRERGREGEGTGEYKVRRGNGCVKKCFIFSHILKIVKMEILALSCLSVRPSVRLSAWKNWVRTKRIFMKFDILGFFENLSREIKFH